MSMRKFKNSALRKTVVKILALRTRGLTMEDIGKSLGLSKNTVTSYLYRAGKNGWLEDLDDPKDGLDFDVMHKVVRNMHDALDSKDEDRRDSMTKEIAKGTIFKRYDADAAQQAPPMTVLAVRIEMPEGTPRTMRPGTAVGVPQYIDGDVVSHGAEP